MHARVSDAITRERPANRSRGDEWPRIMGTDSHRPKTIVLSENVFLREIARRRLIQCRVEIHKVFLTHFQ